MDTASSLSLEIYFLRNEISVTGEQLKVFPCSSSTFCFSLGNVHPVPSEILNGIMTFVCATFTIKIILQCLLWCTIVCTVDIKREKDSL